MISQKQRPFSTRQHTTLTTEMRPVGFEPAIAARELQHTRPVRPRGHWHRLTSDLTVSLNVRMNDFVENLASVEDRRRIIISWPETGSWLWALRQSRLVCPHVATYGATPQHGLSDGPCRATTFHGLPFSCRDLQSNCDASSPSDVSIHRAGLLDSACKARLINIFAMKCKGRSDFNHMVYGDHKQMAGMLRHAHCVVMCRCCVRVGRT